MEARRRYMENLETRKGVAERWLRLCVLPTRKVFDRNEYAYDLPKEKFKNLIVEMTGLKASDPTVNAIVGPSSIYCRTPNFDAPTTGQDSRQQNCDVDTKRGQQQSTASRSNPTGLNLSYTINLNLPETSDVEVFNAIFEV